ncbi:hypothetical protein PV326_011075, partial [Microctonus aethiopoides]
MHVARPWIIICRLRSSRSWALEHGIVADFINYRTLVANILCSPNLPGSSYLEEQLQQSDRRGSANGRDPQSQQCRNPTQYLYYEPSEPWRIQIPNSIKPVPQNKKHIQILHSLDQHWVCSYYDGGNLFIHDSLNKKGFQEGHFEYLSRLFPSYRYDLRPVQFPTVQQQPNFDDCGVFAIAFAISLLFNIDPHKDLKFRIPQKVHSLLPIATFEAESSFLYKSQGNVDNIKQKASGALLADNNCNYKFVKKSHKYLVNTQNILDSGKNFVSEMIKVHNNQTDIITPKRNDTKHESTPLKECTQHEQHNYKPTLEKTNNETAPSFKQKRKQLTLPEFLKQLFPTYFIDKRLVQFPDVQQQPNSRDCGIFAFSFAISLLFDIDPHQYGPPHKVLPLASIRVREAEATRLHMFRRNKKQYKKIKTKSEEKICQNP